jgi:methyltransferase (TIGR00027 family)
VLDIAGAGGSREVNDSFASSVTDTAKWMATYRAWESARSDALFKDALAARLAGDRGPALAQLAPRQVRDGWPAVIRTKLVDDMIMGAVADGCGCVINLAAGFDTRPYRLPLPASLTWIEADFPSLIDEKERLLSDVEPICSLLRKRVDLADRSARDALFSTIQRDWHNALVICEGFLVYLDDASVRQLATDLIRHSAIRSWIVDFFSPGVLRMMLSGLRGRLDRSPLRFAPLNGVEFFEALGWQVEEIRSIFREASRLGRAPFLVRLAEVLPDADPRNLGRAKWAGVVRLRNAPFR